MNKKSRKLLRKTQRKAKKKAKFLLRHPLLVPVTTFFVIVFAGLSLFVAAGATTQGAQDARIVNLYVDDEKQTISTRAKTVDDFLSRAAIDLIPEDIVEPARDTEILEDNTQVNVYRARPVSVIDGDRIVTVLSAQRAPRLLAEEAGFDLLLEDDVAFSREASASLTTTPGEQLIIDRSVEVQLNVYGVVTSLRTTVDTVGELLVDQGVMVGDDETVQPANLSTAITSGQLVSVNRPGIKTAAVTEPVPFTTESRTDPSLSVGESVVEREGVDGQRAVIYEITEENGVETSRREIQTVITRQPVSKVTVVGTKPATLSSSINVSADKAALMTAAGIAPSDHVYVDFIIAKESNWRPGARNASSGAYGLCQALPASKMASAGSDYLTNPVTQLRWCTGYANGRYGGWQGAYNAWLVQRWW